MERIRVPYQQRKKEPWGPSQTIPGQSLKPAALLERHLAGTLPDIDQTTKYEYHYDENGEQIAEPLPLEMHKFHELAVALREQQFKAATEHRKKMAEKERQKIIADYLKSQEPKPGELPTPSSTKPAPEG